MTQSSCERASRTRVALQRVASIAAIAAASAAVSGCGKPPLGPSLGSVTLEGVGLRSTAGNASLCCCQVIGRATNRNSVPVHVTIKFSTYDSVQGTPPGDPLASIVYFIKDLPPQQAHDVEASGFLFSCARVRDIKWEIDVNGLDEEGGR